MFHSVLWEGPDARASTVFADDEVLDDLHLDQVLGALTTIGREYSLDDEFHTPLASAAAVAYRHDVFRDLERPEVAQPLEDFAEGMRGVRRRLDRSARLHNPQQLRRWVFDGFEIYRTAVERLRDALIAADPRSRALSDVRDYLTGYTQSPDYQRIVAETVALQEVLGRVRYTLHIEGHRVHMDRYADQPDYTAAVEAAFARFRPNGDIPAPRRSDWSDMNPVEEQILAGVVELFPDAFAALDSYYERNAAFLDPALATFDREIQFYVTYLAFMRRFRDNGLHFTYPDVTAAFDDIRVEQAYDLAAAHVLIDRGNPIVCNDFQLTGQERILVVTGPNQGGKTTFARMVGQLTYLAALGCPVPATSARLMLADRLFTHFDRQEDPAGAQGKLEEELNRIARTIGLATENSLVVMNESFSSTTTDDALVIGADILRRIVAIRSIAVYVTFLDELADFDPSIVSMVGSVDPENPTRRTYRIERRPADGFAHATALAARYGLTYESLLGRVAR